MPALTIAPPHRPSLLAGALWVGAHLGGACAAEPMPEAWQVAGHQGKVLLVIVPASQAGDAAAYARQVAALCQGEDTCFVNFYTNSTGAAVALPLPDAIDHEATAVFRRSAKRGSATFRWSCRMQIEPATCF
jgi:hypothetical protein